MLPVGLHLLRLMGFFPYTFPKGFSRRWFGLCGFNTPEASDDLGLSENNGAGDRNANRNGEFSTGFKIKQWLFIYSITASSISIAIATLHTLIRSASMPPLGNTVDAVISAMAGYLSMVESICLQVSFIFTQKNLLKVFKSLNLKSSLFSKIHHTIMVIAIIICMIIHLGPPILHTDFKTFSGANLMFFTVISVLGLLQLTYIILFSYLSANIGQHFRILRKKVKCSASIEEIIEYHRKINHTHTHFNSFNTLPVTIVIFCHSIYIVNSLATILSQGGMVPGIIFYCLLVKSVLLLFLLCDGAGGVIAQVRLDQIIAINTYDSNFKFHYLKAL